MHLNIKSLKYAPSAIAKPHIDGEDQVENLALCWKAVFVNEKLYDRSASSNSQEINDKVTKNGSASSNITWLLFKVARFFIDCKVSKWSEPNLISWIVKHYLNNGSASSNLSWQKYKSARLFIEDKVPYLDDLTQISSEAWQDILCAMPLPYSIYLI